MTKTSNRFDAFDIVVVPFPYADRLAEKRRPALVISNRKLAPFGLIWVAMITSAENAPWAYDVTIANLARAGLPAPSVVRTAKIACIEPTRVERRAGRLAVSINAAQFGQLTRGASQEKVVEERLKAALEKLRGEESQRQLRETIERKMSEAAGWPPESILLYVPPRKTQAKGIDTFAFDEQGVVRLNEHPAVSEKVNELGRDYQKLWRLIVLVHPEFRDQALPLSEAIDVLVRELWCDFQADGEVDFHDAQRLAVIQEITWFPYIRKAHREAAEDMQELSIDLGGNPIKINWDLFERAPVRTTLSEGTLTSRQYAERALLLQSLVEELGATPGFEDLAIEEMKKRYKLPESIIQPREQKRFELEFQKLTSKNFSWGYEQKEDAKRAFAIKRVAQEIAGEIQVTKSADTQIDKAKGRRSRRPSSRSHSRSSVRPSNLSSSAGKRGLRAKPRPVA